MARRRSAAVLLAGAAVALVACGTTNPAVLARAPATPTTQPLTTFLCGAHPGPAPAAPTGPVVDTSQVMIPGSFAEIVPVDARDAYAVTATCERFRAAATVDGGATWYETLGKTPGGGFAHLVFVSPTAGFAYGSMNAAAASGSPYELGRTTDGGAHWAAVAGLRGYVMNLATAGTAVWALARYETEPHDLVVERSDDGGVTWRTAPGAPPDVPPGGDGQIAPVDAKSAFVVVKPTPRTSLDGRLSYTDDDGASWSPRVDPCPDQGHEQLVVLSATDLWSACSAGYSEVAADVAVYRSGDGGRTWRLAASSASGALPGHTHVGRLAALDDIRAWVAVEGMGVFGTTDGGSTWHLAFPVHDNTPTDVAFLTPTDGWALASGEIWRTSDGRTWCKVSAS